VKPKTPLPWAELPCYFDNQCEAFEPQDADFILRAANAYPVLMDFVSACRYAGADGLDLLRTEATDIMRELR
jgi:hypothetical protein